MKNKNTICRFRIFLTSSFQRFYKFEPESADSAGCSATLSTSVCFAFVVVAAAVQQLEINVLHFITIHARKFEIILWYI